MPRSSAATIRVFHPNHGWGTVVRMCADGRVLVQLPIPRRDVWVDVCQEGVTLEGASFLDQLYHNRPRSQWGYCWNCNKLAPLRRVPTSNRSGEGYECPHCGAISKEPYSTCRDHGADCTLHPPVDPDGEVLPGYYRSPAGLWQRGPWRLHERHSTRDARSYR